MEPQFLIALVLSFAVGCSCRSSPHPVSRLDVADVPAAEGAALDLSAPQLKELTSQHLKTSGRFILPGTEPTAEPRPGVRLELELTGLQNEKAEDGQEAMDVAVLLTARRKDRDGTGRYEFVGQGHIELEKQSPEARKRTWRRALELAVDQAIHDADLLLTALDQSDSSLKNELGSSDPKRRAAALKVLTDRRHPAAADALIAELSSPDVDQVRQAMGALVELKERRAVLPLIELARQKPPSFIREILFALGALGGEEAEAYLFTVAQGSDQPEIQAAADEALSDLRTQVRAAGDGG